MQQTGNVTQVNGPYGPGLRMAAPVRGISSVFDDVLEALIRPAADTGMQRVEVQARGRVSAGRPPEAGDDAASSRKAAVYDTARQPSPACDTEPEAAGPSGRAAGEPPGCVRRDGPVPDEPG